jgi:hypothetical protein
VHPTPTYFNSHVARSGCNSLQQYLLIYKSQNPLNFFKAQNLPYTNLEMKLKSYKHNFKSTTTLNLALATTFHGYILRAHMNIHTLLNNVMLNSTQVNSRIVK